MFKSIVGIEEKDLQKVLKATKDKKYLTKFREKNIEITSKAVKDSVNEDLLISNTISNIDEIDKISNILAKRLREWYELYLPEISREVKDHYVFAKLILEKNKSELMREIKIKESMGAELNKSDLDEIFLLAKEIRSLQELQGKHITYLESLMKKYCQNILELCGVTIGAKLLEIAGSLKRLAILPSSTVQLLGAEKALFRHLTRGARSPKHGLIVNHPIVQNVGGDMKGKAARALADKISICARLDYFKGEFKAKEYRKELEERFK